MNNTGSVNNKPSFCDLIITENCMLGCRMCKMWQSKNDLTGIDIGTWKRFVDSFADFVENKAQIQFVGGEVLLKEGIFDLVNHACRRGLMTTMTTNAFLIDNTIAQEIVDSGLDTIVFSLDGMREETHDFLRGRRGVYERVMRSIDFFTHNKKPSPKIRIVTTIMRPNLGELCDLAEWVHRHHRIDGISFQAVMQPFFTAPDNEWYHRDEFLPLWPDDFEEADAVLDELMKRKRAGYKIENPEPQFKIFKSYFRHPERFVKVTRCNLGYNSVSVNTQGNVFLCLSMEPLGNIRDGTPFRELWVSEKAQRVREAIRNCKNNCKLMINCFFEDERE